MKHLRKFNESMIEDYFKPKLDWKFIYNIQDVVQLFRDKNYEISSSISIGDEMFYGFDDNGKGEFFPEDEIEHKKIAKYWADGQKARIEFIVDETPDGITPMDMGRTDGETPGQAVAKIVEEIKKKYGYISFMDDGSGNWGEIAMYYIPRPEK